ncbi:MAG: ATP-binding protein [Hyphomonadaceae bacterium]
MIKFQDPTTFAAARAHVSSVRWRMLVGALFALGASFVLDSFAAGFGWFLAVILSGGFDAMLGHSYLDARSGQDRRTAGVLFVWGCAFSIAIFSAMTLYLAAAGGGPGRILATLMAASALVSVMLFLFQAPGFMLLTALPATLCLLTMAFLPFQPGPADALAGAIGAACGGAGFLAYVMRAALYNGRLVDGLRGANKQAKERQLEAEAKRAEAEEANRAKSEFLTVMTHELRTPLNAVIGYAELIHEDLQSEGRGELADDASKITGSARHLLGLIDQILNFSSIDAGEDGLAPRDVDIRALMEEAVHAVQDEARANGNRLSMRIDAGGERAFQDAGKLMVSVSALLSNAVKFTADGLIAVTVECEDVEGREMLSIAVSDTGCGIAADNLSRVFMPFTQIDSTVTRAKGGMGLGLSVAQRMAHTLGGDIRVTSEIGAGSTFTLRVPRKLFGAAQSRTQAAA